MKSLPNGVSEFKDFDAVEYEVFDKKEYFLYEGTYFEADLNVEAGKVLRWMRMGQTIEAVPEMLVLFIGEEQFDAISVPNGRSCRLLSSGSRRNLVVWETDDLWGMVGPLRFGHSPVEQP